MGNEYHGIENGERSFEAIDSNDWHNVMNVNCYAPIQITYALLENLKKGTLKKVVNISSIVGIIDEWKKASPKFNLPYQTSKAALNMAVQGTSEDLKMHGITSVALHPGWVRTDMGGNGLGLLEI